MEQWVGYPYSAHSLLDSKHDGQVWDLNRSSLCLSRKPHDQRGKARVHSDVAKNGWFRRTRARNLVKGPKAGHLLLWGPGSQPPSGGAGHNQGPLERPQSQFLGGECPWGLQCGLP